MTVKNNKQGMSGEDVMKFVLMMIILIVLFIAISLLSGKSFPLISAIRNIIRLGG